MSTLFTPQEVKLVCQKIAPEYKLDWKLMYAVAQQESAKDKQGNFNSAVCRLEQNFYVQYIANNPNPPFPLLTPSVKVLLSSSYGIYQLMGEVLRELKYFSMYSELNKSLLSPDGKAMPQLSLYITTALDEFTGNLDWMVGYACRFMDLKVKSASGDIRKALLLYNGGGRPGYATDVLERIKKITA